MWERPWKNVKTLKYPTRFANELRLGVRDNHELDQILQANVILPVVDATREYWNPTIEEQAALNVIEDEERHRTIRVGTENPGLGRPRPKTHRVLSSHFCHHPTQPTHLGPVSRVNP